MSSLKSSIERLASLGEVEHDPDARRTFLEFRDQLTQGKIRAAEKIGEKNNARWTVNPWVKQGILLGFRLGELADMSAGLSFVDKDTFPARQFAVADRCAWSPAARRCAPEPTSPRPSSACRPCSSTLAPTSTKAPWSTRTRWSDHARKSANACT